MVIENPCRCGYQGGYLVVRGESGTSKIHLSEVSSVVLGTRQIYLSAYLLSELARSKISLVVSDERHNPVGQYLPLYGAHNTAKRIPKQLAWGEPIKKRVWQSIVKLKLSGQAQVLSNQDNEHGARAIRVSIAEVRSGDTTNREAIAARLYFAELFGKDFNRDAESPVNAALNFGYAILLSLVNREIVSRGYLTQCGICHRGEYNQFNLACDFMEPFRPIVDQQVLDFLCLDFDRDVKLALYDLPNRRLSYKGGTYKLGSVLGLYTQDCLNALNKKISVAEIEGFAFP